ncbi:MAG: methylated-DNA--[protein]-cysteine S-methyltransferase [Chloroflexi bacterium]|nr:methylated-DNA--[protein]-cysteine S-methyltransferase [Chloroflexota bacterium]
MENSLLGAVWLAVSDERLVAVEYGGNEDEFVAFLAKLTKGYAQRNEAHVARIKDEVLDYLSGARTSWAVDVDLSGITDFQRRVLEEARRVPRGQVATYGEIAKRIGQPKAARAVGQALRRNPVPIVVPCHRVVASDGKLGGYAGEMDDERKVMLLQLEGVVFA